MADPSTILDLAEKVLDVAGRGLEYKSTREILESTTRDLGPLVEQIEPYVKENDLQTEEIEKLKKIIEANREVLDKYKVRWWNFLLAPYYQHKLDGKYQSLLRYCSVQMQVQIARDVKKILSKSSPDDDDDRRRSRSISPRPSKRIRTQTFTYNHEIVFPELTVGLDGPFVKELKSKLLHGDEQVLNLHGLPGSGKTTLAKKLCHDPQVKDKFKSIFFETLGSQFQGSELQDRLPEFGANPVLLVLDDVNWTASKNLVEECRVQMPTGSKIFATSRVPITTLGTCGYPMEQLSEDDAVAPFLHFVQPSSIDFGDREIRKIVLQIVKGCKRLPFALEFIGCELKDKGFEELQKVQLEWSSGQSILDSNSELLAHLKNSLDLLVDESINECFMDLGLFPEDQKIPVSALIDIWTELHDLDERGIYAMTFISKLTHLNLAAGIKVRRIVGRVEDNYYNNHFLETIVRGWIPLNLNPMAHQPFTSAPEIQVNPARYPLLTIRIEKVLWAIFDWMRVIMVDLLCRYHPSQAQGSKKERKRRNSLPATGIRSSKTSDYSDCCGFSSNSKSVVPLKARDPSVNTRANMQKASSWITVLTFPWCLSLSNYGQSLCDEQRSLSIWLALLGMINFTAFLSSLFLMAMCGAHFTRLQISALLISTTMVMVDAYVPVLGLSN